ncbi:hypothetical protein CKO36_06685 [Rhabdochromatium marinum]|nr:hypothetical protein [Rhabdochromatium marinum]
MVECLSRMATSLPALSRWILLLMGLLSGPLPAEDIEFSCSLWGCKEFQRSAELWAADKGQRVAPYEVGYLADNLLGLYRQVLNAHSNEFDLLLIDTIWPGALGKHLLDLRPYVDEQRLATYFQPILDNLTDTQGRLIALPLFADTGILYYRQDLLDRYGFAVPKTWAELEATAEAILEREQNPRLAGFVWQGRAYEGLTCNALEWIASHGGGTIVDRQGQITINNPQARQALHRARAWIGTISPPEVLDETEMDSIQRFRAGEAIFMRNWMEYWAHLEEADSPVRGRVGLAPLPKGGAEGQHAATLGDMSLAVSRYSEHPEAAVALLLFLTDAPSQRRHALERSFPPTLKALYTDPVLIEERGYMAVFQQVLEHSVARPSQVTGLAYPKVSKKFYTKVHEILSGALAVSPALTTLEAELQQIRQRSAW